jgi:hypothetical protein
MSLVLRRAKTGFGTQLILLALCLPNTLTMMATCKRLKPKPQHIVLASMQTPLQAQGLVEHRFLLNVIGHNYPTLH